MTSQVNMTARDPAAAAEKRISAGQTLILSVGEYLKCGQKNKYGWNFSWLSNLFFHDILYCVFLPPCNTLHKSYQTSPFYPLTNCGPLHCSIHSTDPIVHLGSMQNRVPTFLQTAGPWRTNVANLQWEVGSKQKKKLQIWRWLRELP